MSNAHSAVPIRDILSLSLNVKIYESHASSRLGLWDEELVMLLCCKRGP